MPLIDEPGKRVLTDVLDQVEATDVFPIPKGGTFNVSHRRSGTFVGSYQLERRFGGDPSWWVVLGYNDLIDLPETFALSEVEVGGGYRWNMTARTAGSVDVRISA